MADTLEFDPAAADSAIGHLNQALDAARRDAAVIESLQRITCPGDAPATTAFHTTLGSSMARLRERHEAFRTAVENQIEMLRTAKQHYLTSDDGSAHVLRTVDDRLAGHRGNT